jgi:hypothetical protein
MPMWKISHPGAENLTLAVMGCVVNGPGESRHANIGISLPGTGEAPVAPVFIDGEKAATLRGDDIASQFVGDHRRLCRPALRRGPTHEAGAPGGPPEDPDPDELDARASTGCLATRWLQHARRGSHARRCAGTARDESHGVLHRQAEDCQTDALRATLMTPAYAASRPRSIAPTAPA